MKVKKLVIKALYDLNGEYIIFPDNPLHNTTYENVDVKIEKKEWKIGGESYMVDVITISGQDSIECELVSRHKDEDGTLTLKICQDWG